MYVQKIRFRRCPVTNRIRAQLTYVRPILRRAFRKLVRPNSRCGAHPSNKRWSTLPSRRLDNHRAAILVPCCPYSVQSRLHGNSKSNRDRDPSSSPDQYDPGIPEIKLHNSMMLKQRHEANIAFPSFAVYTTKFIRKSSHLKRPPHETVQCFPVGFRRHRYQRYRAFVTFATRRVHVFVIAAVRSEKHPHGYFFRIRVTLLCDQEVQICATKRNARFCNQMKIL